MLSLRVGEEELKEIVTRERDLENIFKEVVGGLTRQTVKQGYVMVRFLKDVPSFVGIDLKVWGPFKKEDIAVIPYENAKALVKAGVVEEVKQVENSRGN